MLAKALNKIEASDSFTKKGLVILMAAIVPLIAVFLLKYGLHEKFLVPIGAVIMVFSLLASFNTVYSFFILSIFIPYASFLHASVFFTLLLAISFLFVYRGYSGEDFNITLNKAILIYLLSVIPSLFNSVNILASLGKGYNLIGMLVVLYITVITCSKREDIARVINLFLFGVLVNTVYVVILGVMTGKRVFGFSGVFYVDFVGLASLYTGIRFIYSQGSKKIFHGSLLLFFIAGLIITQTRNAWLSFGLSFALLILFLLLQKRGFIKEKKRLLVHSVTVLAVVAIVYAGVSLFSTGLEKRLDQQAQESVLTESTASVGDNSFITRALIWHTAYNAFSKHPVAGIGLYSFPFSSHLYYTIPESFYKAYVENLTPHVTFIAVITETGIIGFAGFVFLLFSILRIVYRNLNRVPKEEWVEISLIVNWSFVYIIISMFMTDAWLWGQQIMIMGFLLGFLMVLNKHKLNADADR